MKKLNPLMLVGVALLLISSVSASYWIYSQTLTVSVAEYTLDLKFDQILVSPIPLYTLVNLSATLKFNGNPVSGATIYLFINDVDTKQLATNALGVANFQINVTQKITYNFQARYLVA